MQKIEVHSVIIWVPSIHFFDFSYFSVVKAVLSRDPNFALFFEFWLIHFAPFSVTVQFSRGERKRKENAGVNLKRSRTVPNDLLVRRVLPVRIRSPDLDTFKKTYY